MTAQGGDILAWLGAAITAREAAAQAASHYGSSWARPIDTDVVRVSPDGAIWFQCLSDEIAEHIVLSHPASVLRRSAADRKVLKIHRAGGGNCIVCADEEDFDENSEGVREWTRSAMPYPCPTVRAVAEGYGWTEQTSASDRTQTPPVEGDRVT